MSRAPKWAIYRLKSTPAALLGYLEAADEESAHQAGDRGIRHHEPADG
jgi:hypothetical protein